MGHGGRNLDEKHVSTCRCVEQQHCCMEFNKGEDCRQHVLCSKVFQAKPVPLGATITQFCLRYQHVWRIGLSNAI